MVKTARESGEGQTPARRQEQPDESRRRERVKLMSTHPSGASCRGGQGLEDHSLWLPLSVHEQETLNHLDLL